MIENIVFKGGGISGIAYIYALKEMYRTNSVLQNLTNYAGTSVGALLAACLCLNFDSLDLDILAERLIQFANTHDWPVLWKAIWNIYQCSALFKRATLRELVLSILRIKCDRIDETTDFQDLFEMTHKKLTVTVLSLNQQKTIYINHEKYPHLKLVDVLVASMSIPGIFEPGQLRLGSGTQFDTCVDSGISEPFPIFIFNPDHSKTYVSEKTLGFMLHSSSEVLKVNSSIFTGRMGISSKLDFCTAYGSAAMYAVEEQNISQSLIDQTIVIQTLGKILGPINSEDITFYTRSAEEAVHKWNIDQLPQDSGKK